MKHHVENKKGKSDYIQDIKGYIALLGEPQELYRGSKQQ
jgi:hypothetical protein